SNYQSVRNRGASGGQRGDSNLVVGQRVAMVTGWVSARSGPDDAANRRSGERTNPSAREQRVAAYGRGASCGGMTQLRSILARELHPASLARRASQLRDLVLAEEDEPGPGGV